MKKTLLKGSSFFIPMIAIMLSSCGKENISESTSVKGFTSEDQTLSEGDEDMVIPPKEYYEEALKENLRLIETGEVNQLSQKPILYVNFDGATLKKGYSRDQSFILCRAQATIPKTNYSAEKRAEVLKMVAAYYNKAGVSLSITDKKPESGSYTTIHVGGTYRTLGCARGGSILGIAPYDVGNKNPNDVGFAFTNDAHSVFTIATTIAHEAGHSYGLAHVGSTACVMYPTIQKNIQGFQSVAKQNSPAVLRKALGSGNADVEGQSNAAESGETANQSATSPSSGNQSGGSSTPSSPASPSANVIPSGPILNQFADILKNIQGNQIIDIQSILPIILQFIPGGSAFIPQIDLILSALQLLGQLNPNLGIGNISSGQLPDLLNLLGASPNMGPVQKMQFLSQISKQIDTQFSGNAKDAMTTLIRIAYAQSLLP